MSTKIYTILSNQNATHSNLKKTVEKHVHSKYQKPTPEFARTEYNRLCEFVKTNNRPIILDSCCGKAESSISLSKKFPGHIIVGIDRSAKRLESKRTSALPPNIILLQANCEDLWSLVLDSHFEIAKHFIFYPNPYPKSSDLKKRWHGHPIFPVLLELCPNLEIRSDWKLYLEEFQIAAGLLGYKSKLEEINCSSLTNPISAFEKKYKDNNHPVFRLLISQKIHTGPDR